LNPFLTFPFKLLKFSEQLAHYSLSTLENLYVGYLHLADFAIKFGWMGSDFLQCRGIYCLDPTTRFRYTLYRKS